MEIFRKEISKEFLKSLPQGMKLIRGNNENFLVVEKVFCPNGHSLMDDATQIHGVPAIKSLDLTTDSVRDIYLLMHFGEAVQKNFTVLFQGIRNHLNHLKSNVQYVWSKFNG